MHNNSYSKDLDSLELREILFLFKKYLGLISILFTITMLLTVVYSLTKIPIYKSTATVAIELPNQTQTIFDFNLRRSQDIINNEVEILKSRSVFENVIHNLLESTGGDNMFLFSTKEYKPRGYRKIISDLLSLKPNIKIENKDFTDLGEFNLVVQKLRSLFSVKNVRNTNVLQISVASIDATEAAVICNAIAETYQSRDLEWSAGELINLRNFLKDQLVNVETDLQSVENELKNYSEKEEIYGLDGNSQSMLEQLSGIESRYYNILAEISIIKERKRYINDQLSKEEKSLTNQLLNSINTRLFTLRKQIAKNEADLTKHKTLYGSTHEAVPSMEQKIQRLKNELANQTNSLISQGISVADPIKYRQTLIDTAIAIEATESNLQSRADEYKKLVNQYSSELNELPGKALHYARLERDRNILSETYSLMRQKFEEARISEASQLGKVRIIDLAIPPLYRTSPNTIIDLLLGTLFGALLCALTIMIIEKLDHTIKSGKDIENLGFPVLGIIPSFDSKKESRYSQISKPLKTKRRSSKRHVIVETDPRSPISEAFRSLRTNLVYADDNLNKKSIVVSSPSPGEGKTTIIANLATAFASMGKSTLLIDADLRKPRLHRTFDIPNEVGLSDYLIGEVNDHNIVITPTTSSNLSVITSGKIPGNPSELLGTERMFNFISSLEERWNIILIDSPPIVAVTDAMIVSKAIDGLVLVVKAGKTQLEALSHTVSIIDQIGANLSGIVLNGLSRDHSYHSYYYYQHYYYDDRNKKGRRIRKRKKEI